MQFNIIIENYKNYPIGEYLSQLLFNDEPILYFPKGTKLIDILVKCNVFKSKKDAKRNNWNLELDNGYQEFKIGKNHLFVLNTTNTSSTLEKLKVFAIVHLRRIGLL